MVRGSTPKVEVTFRKVTNPQKAIKLKSIKINFDIQVELSSSSCDNSFLS